MTNDDSDSPVPALLWGIRESFVTYVAALGTVTVRAPATERSASLWRFPLHENRGNTLRFSGRVDFLAHDGLLALTIEDPWLEGGATTDAPRRLTIRDPPWPTILARGLS